MRVRSVIVILSLAAGSAACLFAQKTKPEQARLTSDVERAALHNSSEWQLLEPHLPNPQTASVAQLETAGDVLRARRFPEDALDYYGYAMARGGDVSELLNKMGITRLELRQNDLARQMFLRTVRAKKNDAQAWNNLGVTEYSDHNYRAAISDYKRATKLNYRLLRSITRTWRMAYLEDKDMQDNARVQLSLRHPARSPLSCRRMILGGVTAHVIGSENYGEMCFEMARLYRPQPQCDSNPAMAGEGQSNT